MNFKAIEYYDCIDWIFFKHSELPSFSSEEIQNNINSGSILEEELVLLPSKIRAMGRTVKIVTKAALKIWGFHQSKAAIEKKYVKIHF